MYPLFFHNHILTYFWCGCKYCLEYYYYILLQFENHAIFSYCQNVLLGSQNSKSALSDIIKKFWAFPTWLVTACLQRKRKKIFWCQSILASSSEHPLSLHSETQLKILFRNYWQKNRPAFQSFIIPEVSNFCYFILI